MGLGLGLGEIGKTTDEEDAEGGEEMGDSAVEGAQQKTVFEQYSPFAETVADQIIWRTTVKMGRHTKIIAGGRVFSYSALVVVGTGNGAGGIGYGKALKAPEAVMKATKDAEKNMIPIFRYKGRTIKKDLVAKYVSTKVVCAAHHIHEANSLTQQPIHTTLLLSALVLAHMFTILLCACRLSRRVDLVVVSKLADLHFKFFKHLASMTSV
jgi:hypothetical protein